jgi:hypothetical protein
VQVIVAGAADGAVHVGLVGLTGVIGLVGSTVIGVVVHSHCPFI